jgi:hypothetical protein
MPMAVCLMPLKILDVLALIFAAPIMITISDKISDISPRVTNCVYIYVFNPSLPPTTTTSFSVSVVLV